MTKHELDGLLFEIDELEKEIIRLNLKPTLSYREYDDLNTKKKKLKHLRRIAYEN